jgi:Putative auto-transporter adhesin, head GIN domain
MGSMAAATLIAFALVGWSGEKGNGNIKEEQRQVAEFTGVEVGGGVELEIRTGGERRVTISADENVLPLLETKVENGVLQLRRANGLRPTRTIKLTVVTPKLEWIGVSGGVTLKAHAPASTKLTLEGSGGTEIDVRGIDVENLVVELTGGGQAQLAGKAKSARFELSGGVVLDAQGLEVETARIDASGGVDARIAVSKEITGEMSGGVGVRVKGRPSVKIDSSGGSAIRTE